MFRIFNNRNSKSEEAAKVEAILQRASSSNDLYEVINCLKEYLTAVKKIKGIYNEKGAAKSLLINKIGNITGLGLDTRQKLDNIFLPKPGYVPLEERLEEIGITKDEIYCSFYQNAEKQLDSMLIGAISNITESKLNNNTYSKEHIDGVSLILSQKRKNRDEFRIKEETLSNDLYIKYCFDHGNKFLELIVANEPKGSQRLDFLLAYNDLRNGVIGIFSELKLEEGFNKKMKKQLQNTDETAARIGLQNIYNHLNSGAVELGFFSDDGLLGYSIILGSIKNFIESNLEENKQKKYNHLFININTQFEKIKNIAKETALKQQNGLYKIAFDLAQKASDKYELTRNYFIGFSRNFSELLGDNENTLNAFIEQLEGAYIIAYADKNKTKYTSSNATKN